MAEYGLRQPFCGFVCLLWSNAAESLWPKTSVSKDAVCFGFVSSDRGWAAAVLTLGAWPKSCSQMSKIPGEPSVSVAFEAAHKASDTLIVLGVAARPSDALLFGSTADQLLETSQRSLLFVAS